MYCCIARLAPNMHCWYPATITSIPVAEHGLSTPADSTMVMLADMHYLIGSRLHISRSLSKVDAVEVMTDISARMRQHES